MKVSIDEKAKELVIRIPLLNTPEVSGSGKSLMIASTHGNMTTDLKHDGKNVVIGLNAYVKIDKK